LEEARTVFEGLGAPLWAERAKAELDRVPVRRAAVELTATEETARWDASAVLSTVAEAVSGGQLNQILSQLPSEYALLFGKPDLA